MEQDPNNLTFVDTREAAGSCPSCRYVMPRLLDSAPAYFKDGFVPCDHCGEHVDLWQAALEAAIRMSIAPAWAVATIGAGKTNFVMPVETGEFYEIQLTNHEVPADAKILSRNYTGQGGDVTAIEWHGNAPPLRFPGTALRLFGVPLGKGPVPRSGRVAVSVVWVRPDDSDAWPYLVTAFESAVAREYAPSLVFAQSAVEISMMPLIEKRLRRHSSSEHVKKFMREAITYSYALNVVLPYFCGEANIRPMNDAIRGSLNKMRKKRNDIIHEGTKAAAITAADAMEGLCASAFGFEYMRYVGPTLLGGK